MNLLILLILTLSCTKINNLQTSTKADRGVVKAAILTRGRRLENSEQNEQISQLIEAGAEVNVTNDRGETPLTLAAANDNYQNNIPEVIKELVEAGANVNAKNSDEKTALVILVEREDEDVEKSQLLIEAGADVNTDIGGTPILLHILECEYDIDYVNKIAKLLIERGADINITTRGWTLLMLSLYNGYLEVGDALIAKGANIENVTSNDGTTMLMCASKWGYTKIVKALLKLGDFDINAQNRGQETAIILATENGSEECVKALLEAGADVYRRENRKNKRPSEIALKNKNECQMKYQKLSKKPPRVVRSKKKKESKEEYDKRKKKSIKRHKQSIERYSREANNYKKIEEMLIKEEAEQNIDNNPEILSSFVRFTKPTAATKIQALWRGYSQRKKYKKEKATSE